MNPLSQPGSVENPRKEGETETPQGLEFPEKELPSQEGVQETKKEEQTVSTPEMVIEEPMAEPEPAKEVVKQEPPSSIEQADVESEINTVEQAYRLANKIGS